MPARDVLGFCLGGTLAFGVAVEDSPIGVRQRLTRSGVPDMRGRIGEVSCPTLLHFGRDDAYIAGDGVEALAEAITSTSGFVLDDVAGAGQALGDDAMYAPTPKIS